MESDTEAFNMQETTTITEDDLDKGWAVGGIENSSFVRTIYGLIAFSGIAGNATVCFVLIRVPALRTRTSLFIINLAVNDFATSILVIPHHLFPTIPPVSDGFAGQLVCRLFVSKYLMWASVVASVCSLLAVTAERYFAVVHPVRYKIYFTAKVTAVIIATCWVFSLVLATFHLASYKPLNGMCIYIPITNPLDQKMLGLFFFLMMYALPIIIILVLHARIISSLRHQANALDTGNRRGEVGANQDRWQLRAAHEMQITLLVVVLVTMLCWGPNHILFLAFTFGARVDFASQYYHFTVIIALCNSCVNPFIYVFKNGAFRRGVRQAFGCRCGDIAVNPSGSGTGTGTDKGNSTGRGTGSTNA